MTERILMYIPGVQRHARWAPEGRVVSQGCCLVTVLTRKRRLFLTSD
jgi:hypothetical protein